MMKTKQFLILFLLTVAGLLFFSCGNSFFSKNRGEGTVYLSIGDSSGRFAAEVLNVFPEFESVTVRVSQGRTSVKTQTITNTSSVISMVVPAGNNYTISVEAAAKPTIKMAETPSYFSRTYSGTVRGVSVNGGNNTINVPISLQETNIVFPSVISPSNMYIEVIDDRIKESSTILEMSGTSDLYLTYLPFFDFDRYGNLYMAYTAGPSANKILFHAFDIFDPVYNPDPFKIGFPIGIPAIPDNIVGLAYYDAGGKKALFFTDGDKTRLSFIKLYTRERLEQVFDVYIINLPSGETLGDGINASSPIAADKNGNIYAITSTGGITGDYCLSKYQISPSVLDTSGASISSAVAVDLTTGCGDTFDRFGSTVYSVNDMKVIGGNLYILQSCYGEPGIIVCFDISGNKPVHRYTSRLEGFKFPQRITSWGKDKIYIYDAESIASGTQKLIEFDTIN